MLLWIGIALLAGGCLVALRWWVARTDGLGRPRSFPVASVLILLVLGCASLTPWLLRMRLQHRLSVAATAVVGTPVEVQCQGFGEAFVDAGGELGFVHFGPDGVPEHSTLIKRDQCRDLSAYLRSDKESPSQAQIVAVHVLSHEAAHMAGITNEAEAECAAVQHDAEMAQLLGARPDSARHLAVTYWQTVFPKMPTEYRSEECGPGRALDAGLPDAPWAISEAGM